MAEVIRTVKVEIEVDTNKQTYVLRREVPFLADIHQVVEDFKLTIGLED